jgi:hypothetical protein
VVGDVKIVNDYGGVAYHLRCGWVIGEIFEVCLVVELFV